MDFLENAGSSKNAEMRIFEAPKSTENALKWPQNDAETRYVGRSTKASEYNGMRQKASGEPSVSGKIQAALWSAEEIFWDAA